MRRIELIAIVDHELHRTKERLKEKTLVGGIKGVKVLKALRESSSKFLGR